MKFAAVIEYIADMAKVNEHRPAHRAYLTALIESGQLVVAGPFLDGFGALIVYEAPDEVGAEALLKADPFHDAGIFVTWTIRPWKTVFGNPGLLPPN